MPETISIIVTLSVSTRNCHLMSSAAAGMLIQSVKGGTSTTAAS